MLHVNNILSMVKSHKFLSLLCGGGVLLIAFVAIPLPQKLQERSTRAPLRIEDRNGTILYESFDPSYGAHRFVPYNELPPVLITTLITTEDRSFRMHLGVSIRGIARAMIQNLRSGRIVSGGSTITQQLVKIRMKTERRGWILKGYEALLAIKMELALTKNQILEAYLNEAYFGHQAYGVAAAAETYFGKSVHELSQAEMALLIGLLRSPSTYDPFKDLEAAEERRNIVLSLLKETSNLSEEEREEFSNEPLSLAEDRIDIRAPHFVQWLLTEHEDALLNRESIRTTIDANLQREVEDVIQYQLKKLQGKNVSSAAVVILDSDTGEILSMVGSSDFFDEENDGEVNVAISPRQPGSALKPFTYALALEDGKTAATTVADTDVQMLTQEGNPYTPRNYDYEHHGLVRYREALANSYNIPAIKVAGEVGVSRILTLLKAAGITTLKEDPEFYGVALTLGDGEVSLLELTKAYAIFPRLGQTLPLRVFDEEEKIETQEETRKVLSPQVSWLISDILSDSSARISEFGLENLLEFPYPVAAKTGTTRNTRDNWVIGFTPHRLVGVWVGNADNTPMRGTTGITGAGPIFHDAMELAMRSLPKDDFAKPEEIGEKEICATSGKLPSEACDRRMTEYFIRGTEPMEVDTMHQILSLDRRNGLLAGEECDPKFIQKENFILYPPELLSYARKQGYREPPKDYSPLCSKQGGPVASDDDEKNTSSWIRIVHPQIGDSFLLDPLIPDTSEKIILEAEASPDIREVHWFIDETEIGIGEPPDFRIAWQPHEGNWRIRVIAGEHESMVRISILK